MAIDLTALTKLKNPATGLDSASQVAGYALLKKDMHKLGAHDQKIAAVLLAVLDAGHELNTSQGNWLALLCLKLVKPQDIITPLDFTPENKLCLVVINMMEAARDYGISYPEFHIQTATGIELKLKWVGAKGQVPGSVNVTMVNAPEPFQNASAWVGRILPDGAFHASQYMTDKPLQWLKNPATSSTALIAEIRESLSQLALEPIGMLESYLTETGKCPLCLHQDFGSVHHTCLIKFGLAPAKKKPHKTVKLSDLFANANTITASKLAKEDYSGWQAGLADHFDGAVDKGWKGKTPEPEPVKLTPAPVLDDDDLLF